MMVDVFSIDKLRISSIICYFHVDFIYVLILK
jgi:hypothetical protein